MFEVGVEEGMSLWDCPWRRGKPGDERKESDKTNGKSPYVMLLQFALLRRALAVAATPRYDMMMCDGIKSW